ncbi:MAG TPA: tRNA (5-methylaminomethyl-2-thiouridine)(34)-methyltransferase MnmD [Bacteroidales bacterium]
MKKLQLIKTADGSNSLFNAEINENYHSSFGAIQESKHIFIEAGLNYIKKLEVSILEIGLGTGLNALLAIDWATKNKTLVHYSGIEAFPVSHEIISQLNYSEKLGLERNLLEKIHAENGNRITINPFCTFEVQHKTIQEVRLPANQFDVVFFDAFSPEVQPEMWEENIFKKIAAAMKTGGVLTTYSCKGIVKRALLSAGFSIEKLSGPPGKREFLRATKT